MFGYISETVSEYVSSFFHVNYLKEAKNIIDESKSKNWHLTRADYDKMNSLVKTIAKQGSQNDKKALAFLLYEACRSNVKGTSEHKRYNNITKYFFAFCPELKQNPRQFVKHYFAPGQTCYSITPEPTLKMPS